MIGALPARENLIARDYPYLSQDRYDYFLNIVRGYRKFEALFIWKNYITPPPLSSYLSMNVISCINKNIGCIYHMINWSFHKNTFTAEEKQIDMHTKDQDKYYPQWFYNTAKIVGQSWKRQANEILCIEWAWIVLSNFIEDFCVTWTK